jgi:outer membrane protein OmpA-like peptidoglycan-associated protein
VTTLVTANGTYVLDPTTGVISFVAVAGFVGTATPATYQVTDAYEFQANSTYTPTVTAPAPVVAPSNPVTPPPAPPAPPVVQPLGVAHVGTASHVVLTGSTLPATCTVTVAAIKTCQTALTAQVAGRQVVLGKSSIVKAHAGATTVKTVIQLNALGRALAAQVGGVKATAWASVRKADGRDLSAKTAVSLVEKHVSVTARVLFPTSSTALTAIAKHQLKALKTQLAGVKTVTCVGYADTAGDAAANVALGKARAKTVCAALAGHGVKLVVVTRGDLHPAADNNTSAGRTLNRRVELTLTY